MALEFRAWLGCVNFSLNNNQPEKGSREKKIFIFVDIPKRGGGVRGCPLRKNSFFNVFFFFFLICSL